MRRLYAIVAWLLAAAIVVQFLLAGIGVFAPNNFCGVVPNDTIGCGFSTHAAWAALVLFPLFVLVLVFAFAARVPWSTTGLSAALFGLFFLQGLLIWPYYDGPYELKPLSAFHVVNGIAVLFVAMRVAGRASDLLRQVPGTDRGIPAEIAVRPAEAKGD